MREGKIDIYYLKFKQWSECGLDPNTNVERKHLLCIIDAS